MALDGGLRTIAGSRVRVAFGAGQLARLGELAKSEGARRVLLVTDEGIVRAGHVERGLASLREEGMEAVVFAGARENPTTREVDAGLAVAREHRIDLIVGLGGGSSMDCAKGINFLLTNGGEMRDYWGVNKATKAMLPLIAVPTTAGTGSEAQSFALITDPETHEKMACGDEKALPRVAILDPELVATCPARVAAATGIDAVSHAVETAGCKKRNETSRRLSREAWGVLSGAFETRTGERAADMLMGAHLAGAAIQNSMLGATHSCANPLTAKFGIVHGVAVGVMLPHVVAFNAEHENPYSDLDRDPARLVRKLNELLAAAGIARGLRAHGVPKESLEGLAEMAALQWTAAFNPRQVGKAELLEIYRRAWDERSPSARG